MTRIARTFRGILMLLVSAPLFAGAADRIIIGQAIDLSGPNAAIGRDYVAGIKTYFDAVNSKGGISGRRIQYIVRDDQGKPELSARLSTELIAAENVDFLLGSVGMNSTNAILNTQAFRRSNLVLFAPLATENLTDNTQVMMWRPQFQDEMRYLYSYFSKVGIKNVGLVMQDASSHEQSLQRISAEMQARDLNVVGIAHIGANGERSASEAARLAAAKPGLVLVFADSIAGGLFLKEFRTHASQTFVAGTSLTNLETLREIAGPKAVEWTVFSQVVPNPNTYSSGIQAEHIAMMRKYRDESVSALTLEGFAVAKALVHIIEKAKNYRSAIREFRANKNAEIDLGGLSIVNSEKMPHLSSYLDVALFRKGTRLVY
ncbi:ABC transporter substrate-binding protein [Oxalobacteraceae bacterium R-40]|uniref:ABC transporter substrate-binding protein n=1 Tax=Keguizhuia sedimenti TaxID=3064264 RepID=A0ABU1BPI6_9BURK|nr:ABC transporter substrate-binding protein [Oxalobacteraceae bacterium R-40]